MRRGKEVAQGAHASMAFIMRQLLYAKGSTALITLSESQRAWVDSGTAKVCLRVNTEQELLDCHHKAIEAGLDSHIITDSGRTEFGGVPTLTACAIGPDDQEKIDVITGHLQLY